MVTCAKGVFDLRLMDAPIPSPAGKLALVAMQLVIQTRSPGTRGVLVLIPLAQELLDLYAPGLAG